jgi:hypothetical protein
MSSGFSRATTSAPSAACARTVAGCGQAGGSSASIDGGKRAVSARGEPAEVARWPRVAPAEVRGERPAVAALAIRVGTDHPAIMLACARSLARETATTLAAVSLDRDDGTPCPGDPGTETDPRHLTPSC